MTKKVKLNLGKTKQLENKLSINSFKIIMTDEETSKLESLLENYIEEHGVTFGFVNWLVGDK